METKTRVVDRSGRRNGAPPPRTPAQPVWHRLGRRVELSASAKEAIRVFTVAYVVYAAIGLKVVVWQHVVMFDAMSRLAHAFFVWHNLPPKLASVGFVWPPVATIVF